MENVFMLNNEEKPKAPAKGKIKPIIDKNLS
jgi:hypothetical protein